MLAVVMLSDIRIVTCSDDAPRNQLGASHFAHLLRPSLCLPAHTRPYSLRASRNPRPQRCTRRAPEAHNAPWGPAIVCEDRYCFGVLVIAPLHSALNFDSLFFRHCSAGILDNTLVYYIIGDNGGSAE